MNAALFNGGKVHVLMDTVARCGVGKHPQRRQWQTEFCAVTCQRCVKLERMDGRKEAQEAQNTLTTEERGEGSRLNEAVNLAALCRDAATGRVA